MSQVKALVVILALFAASCGRPIHGALVEERPRLRAVTRVWIEDSARMPSHLILQGCDLWNVLGVGCVMVADKKMADAYFVAVDRPCVKTPEGRRILALAHAKERTVEMFVDCFRDDRGKIDDTKMATVAGHEMGHQLGIWDHVPRDCGESGAAAVSLPGGAELCGEAVMNPLYDDDVTELTDMDGHAFELRRRDYSVYRPVDDAPDGSPPGRVICTYHD